MISVRADGLGKAYRLYKRPFDSLKELLLRREYSETFWALRDVTFEVPKGGSIGIVGDNGAGKSTLLKLLAGAAAPTTGRVDRVGRVSAMLSLGAGFHPDLSGLDNIRIGCAVLGLSPAETQALLPAIVDFSELGTFVDRPVRTYSSGMQLRLGFSVATAVNPDVLVVDEHLSVGDQHFRHKCLRRIGELRESGCALVFCSHDMHAVGEVCERTLWLRDGQPAMLAATQPVLKAYQDYVRARDAETSPVQTRATAPDVVKRERVSDSYLKEVTLGGDCERGLLHTGGTLAVNVIAYVTPEAYREGVHIGVLLIRNDAVWCYGVSTQMDNLPPTLHRTGDNEYGIALVMDAVPLLSGEYTFTVALMDARSPHVYDSWTGAAPLRIRHEGKDVGVARLSHRWESPK
jgi:lipopolysaccharide transport system ATP-binding protein